MFVHNLLAFCRFAQRSILIGGHIEITISHTGARVRTGEGWRKNVSNIFIIALRSNSFSGSSRTMSYMYQADTINRLSLTKLQRKFAKGLLPKGVRLENPQVHSPTNESVTFTGLQSSKDSTTTSREPKIVLFTSQFAIQCRSHSVPPNEPCADPERSSSFFTITWIYSYNVN